MDEWARKDSIREDMAWRGATHIMQNMYYLFHIYLYFIFFLWCWGLNPWIQVCESRGLNPWIQVCESSLLANDLPQVACLPFIRKSYVFHVVCRHVCVQYLEQMVIQLRLALEK